MMNRTATLSFRLLLVAATMTGAQAAETHPDAAHILAAMRQASGGDAWNNVQALHLSTETGSGSDKAARQQWEDVRTGRYRQREAGAQSVSEGGFDGITSWRQGMSGIAYTLGDPDSALVAADESYRVARAWWFGERHAATVAWIGTKSENGHRFDILSITPEGGRPFEVWIDKATHLLARIDEQQAEDRVVTSYADYRKVGGILLPFTIRSGDGVHSEFDAEEHVVKVEINPQIADRFFAVPAEPPSDVEWPAGTASIEIPFRLTTNNRPMVQVTVDGVTVEAEFDSGGSLLLQPDSVAKLGAKTTGRQMQSGGGEGVTSASRGHIGLTTIGAAKIRNLAFHSFAFHPNAPQEALIGLEILQRFVVRLDFDRGVMTLSDPASFVYRGTGSVIPFHFQDNQPEVTGSIDGIADRFAIDTGDNGSLLLIAPFARRYGLAARYHADVPYSGKAIGATRGVWARQRPATVTLDGADGRPAVAVHNPVTRISLQNSGFDASRTVSANIGLGIIRQFNTTFDYSRRMIILEPNHFYGQPDVFNRTGFRVEQKDKVWVISNVYPVGPAQAAGLKTGDSIETVNGVPAEKLSDDDFDRIMRGVDGSKLELTIRSAKTTRTVSLILHDVF